MWTKSVGPISSVDHPFGFRHIQLFDQNCDTCKFYNGAINLHHLLGNHKEITTPDSFFYATTTYPPQWFIDPGVQDLSIFEGLPDPLDDSIVAFMANIPNLIQLTPSWKWNQTAAYSARIFRYQDYDSISSPWLSNKAVITAVAGTPATWNPGIVDNEGDSVVVSHLLMPITLTQFPTHGYCSNSNPTGPPDTAIVALAMSGFRDSISMLPYKPGYSYDHPFGNTASYSLDSHTGAISFTAPDSGIYYLAYKITEYRDGLPLGEVQVARVAYVLPSPGGSGPVLPVSSGVQNAAVTGGGSYSSAQQKFSVCEGSTIYFTQDITSALSDAHILVSQNYSTLLAGSTVNITGQNTNSVHLSVSWTAPAGAGGGAGMLYQPYISWTDTACGHYSTPGSSGVSIKVGNCATGVDAANNSEATALRVWPNPGKAGEGARLRLGGPAGKSWEVVVSDGLGREVARFEALSGRERQFGAGLPAGVYLISATGQDGTRLYGKWVAE